jgi:hypothetical protein
MNIAALIPALCSVGVLSWFFISTGRAIQKFNCLDSCVRHKLLLLEYYMAAVRNLSKEELALLGTLPNEEIVWLNAVHDYDERMQAIREKIGLLAVSGEKAKE